MYRKSEPTSDETTGGHDGGFVGRVVWAFTSPKKLIAVIDAEGVGWWEPWIWASLLNMIIAYAVMPIQIKLLELNPQDMTEEELRQTLDIMQRFPTKFLSMGSAPLMVLLAGGLFALISYIAVSILSEHANFRKYFTLYLYSSVIAAVGILLSNVFVRSKGLDNIRSVYDASFSIGPAAFIDANSHKALFAVMSTLDVFSVWGFWFIWVGVAHIFRLTGRSALLVVIPVWLLWVLISLVGARMGSMA